uniref:RING-type E3 ubiquitin transferase n=1 Tax=Sus scrofa TaxID=9823 RepID=A0A8D1IH24_PIG
MAEASPQPGRYFCHCCSVEIVPRLPDYICPRCESGFIEELPEETRSTENGSAPSTAPVDQSRQPMENVDQPLFTLPQGYGHFAFGIFDDSFEIPTFPPGAQADDGRDPESRREREQHPRHRYGARQPRARLTARRTTGRHEGVPTLEGIIQQLVNGIITPATIPNLGLGPWGVLHSNPMDYAWGANGLDAIITQALGWSALCARTTTGWVSVCASCPATTSSMMAVSCPGWSSTTAAPSAERASQDRTQPLIPQAWPESASPPPRPPPPAHPVTRTRLAAPECPAGPQGEHWPAGWGRQTPRLPHCRVPTDCGAACARHGRRLGGPALQAVEEAQPLRGMAPGRAGCRAQPPSVPAPHPHPRLSLTSPSTCSTAERFL